MPPEVEAAAEALREARERYRKPGGHYLTDDLRAERRRLGKLTDDLLAALSSARSAAPALPKEVEAAAVMRAALEEIVKKADCTCAEDWKGPKHGPCAGAVARAALAGGKK